MNETQAIALAKYVAALAPQQKFNEYTPDAWGNVFADVDFNDAKRAAENVLSRQPFAAPAEIRKEVARIRGVRIDAAQPVYSGDPDESPAEYVGNRRQMNAAAGAGRLQPRSLTAAIEAPARVRHGYTEDDVAALRREGDLLTVMHEARRQAIADNVARRKRVLDHPDLAARLTSAPLNYRTAQSWAGSIPPEFHANGARNKTAQRAALVAIVEEVERRAGATRGAAA